MQTEWSQRLDVLLKYSITNSFGPWWSNHLCIWSCENSNLCYTKSHHVSPRCLIVFAPVLLMDSRTRYYCSFIIKSVYYPSLGRSIWVWFTLRIMAVLRISIGNKVLWHGCCSACPHPILVAPHSNNTNRILCIFIRFTTMNIALRHIYCFLVIINILQIAFSFVFTSLICVS